MQPSGGSGQVQTIVLISMHMRTFGAYTLISQPDKSDALQPVPYSDYLLKYTLFLISCSW